VPVYVSGRKNLIEFLRACAARKLKVALSSWFWKDSCGVRRLIRTLVKMARIWNVTLEIIRAEGLLHMLLFVNLCNEWPGISCAPFFVNQPPELIWGGWHTAPSMQWLTESVRLVRAAFRRIPPTYSFNPNSAHAANADLAFLDLFEPHIWIAECNGGECYREVGHEFPLADPRGSYARQAKADKTYAACLGCWQNLVTTEIRTYSEVSRRHRNPRVTTKCWGAIDYKKMAPARLGPGEGALPARNRNRLRNLPLVRHLPG